MKSVIILSILLFFIIKISIASIPTEFLYWKELKAHSGEIVSAEYVKRQQQCPNQCSGHGGCINGGCVCGPNWTGQDCSIAIAPLPSGMNVTGQVATYGWQYYNLSIPLTSSAFNLEVWQTNAGDCDIYVQYQQLPTRTSYYRRDISTYSYVLMTFPSVLSGFWIIGIYGFSACSFQIRATVQGTTCPNDCSGHGSCSNGVCQCNSGWYGSDCSSNYLTLPLSTDVSGHANTYQMIVYRVDYSSSSLPPVQNWLLRQGVSGDCDLYLKFGSAPTNFQWDYANVTTQQTSTIVVQNVQRGFWYAGVYGYHACDFTIRIDPGVATCPNTCSKRGNCAGMTCQCPSSFSGVACETMNSPLSNGQVVDGFVDNNYWNYYRVSFSSVSNLMITINQQQASADCDLYVRRGQTPTRLLFDYNEVETSQSFTLTIPDPGTSTWYIGVYGFTSCTYNITAYTTSACPQNCNARGTCQSGNCQCNTGFTGVACENTVIPLTSGQIISGVNVTVNSWQLYSIVISSSNTLNVQLKETNGEGGLLWLFVNADIYPSLSDNDARSTETNTNIHRIVMSLNPNSNQRTYYIGVYGNPLMLQNQVITYQLIAWYPSWNN